VFKRVLFVCMGNICRSPAAEAILQHARPELKVSSAGLDALVGELVDEEIENILNKHEIPVRHFARQLDTGMVRRADLIIVMEKFQEDAILEEHPEARGKVVLLGKWNEDEEIEDPYMRSQHTYSKAYKKIKHNIDIWCEKVFI